jgi:hypothetical protein
MSQITDLARGTINGADLIIELLQLGDHPSVVRGVWPLKPSIIPPSRFNAVAADLGRLFASAATRHTQLRAQR